MFTAKNNYFKGSLFLLVFIFLFLTLGAEVFHHHCCPGCHDDCPACIWLINFSLFTPAAIFACQTRVLNLETFLCAYTPPAFITKSYQAFLYLRSPPLSA